MPETGFRFARLKEHLRRWALLYLAAAVVLCFLNHLVYTVTRPRFAESEILRISVMNADFAPDEAALLARVQAADAGIRAVELEYLPQMKKDDSASVMLLVSKLISGGGEIYITDGEGMAMLEMRKTVVQSTAVKDVCIAAVAEDAKIYLPVIAEEIEGVQP